MQKFTRKQTRSAFTLLELMVVVAIIGILSTVLIPLYQSNVRKVNVSAMVNKLGTFNYTLTDTYTATGSWPATINGYTAGTTNADAFFPNAVNFRYNNNATSAWLGYQLSSAYGSGWFFMVIIANTDSSFDVHCGSLNSSCVLGACDSAPYFPSACSETNLDTTYTLE